MAEGGGNQSTSQVGDYIEEACLALQVGDSEGALMQLNLALSELGGATQGTVTNTTSVLTGGITSGGGGTFDDGVTIGGSRPFDDYDADAEGR